MKEVLVIPGMGCYKIGDVGDMEHIHPRMNLKALTVTIGLPCVSLTRFSCIGMCLLYMFWTNQFHLHHDTSLPL